MTEELLIDEVIADEGSRKNSDGWHVAYQDTNGFWTIGYGHLLGPGITRTRCERVTEREARAWLAADLEDATSASRRLIHNFDSLPDNKQRAIVSMVFNRGEPAMRKSTKILPAILYGAESGDWSGVASAIDGSQWAAQVKRRAVRIREELIA